MSSRVRMEASPAREIEAIMSDRLGRPCLFMPSGRIALYVAFRAWLNPGGRILMSPVTDDVIFFTALAAGLRPVMAPISMEDGNIDIGQLDRGLWSGLAGVLTTNLYGLPDRVEELRASSAEHGIPLIEDAAHAIETVVNGRPIGTFGDAAGFSLSKHVGAPCGGVLAFDDEDRRSDLERLRDSVTHEEAASDGLVELARYEVERAVVNLHLVWPARWLRRRLGWVERSGFRMPLREDELRDAIAGGPQLDAFDIWVRTDRHNYRHRPSTLMVERTLARLRRLSADRDRRVEGVEQLRTLPGVAPGAKQGPPQPLFRVPVLVEDRPAMIARVERHIHGIGYIYDPPLDDYAGSEFAEPSGAPDVARLWSNRIFPVDPLEADRFLRSSS